MLSYDLIFVKRFYFYFFSVMFYSPGLCLFLFFCLTRVLFPLDDNYEFYTLVCQEMHVVQCF